jgi:hypothetical protein
LNIPEFVNTAIVRYTPLQVPEFEPLHSRTDFQSSRREMAAGEKEIDKGIGIAPRSRKWRAAARAVAGAADLTRVLSCPSFWL